MACNVRRKQRSCDFIPLLCHARQLLITYFRRVQFDCMGRQKITCISGHPPAVQHTRISGGGAEHAQRIMERPLCFIQHVGACAAGTAGSTHACRRQSAWPPEGGGGARRAEWQRNWGNTRCAAKNGCTALFFSDTQAGQHAQDSMRSGAEFAPVVVEGRHRKGRGGGGGGEVRSCGFRSQRWPQAGQDAIEIAEATRQGLMQTLSPACWRWQRR